MSRLVVKNLPHKISEEKVRETFSKQGLVTDVQLKYTKDGKFRHFGFVGFKTPEDASKALKYFNNTFINSCKIQVELCAGLGDASKPKAWSKYATDSKAYKNAHPELHPEEPKPPVEVEARPKKGKKGPNSIVQKLFEKHKDDPLFMEFMESHVQGKEGGWSNDMFASAFESDRKQDIGPESTAECPLFIKEESDHESEDSDEPAEENKVAKEKISDLEYLKMKTVKVVEEEVAEEESEDDVKNDSKPPRIKMPKQPKEKVELFTVKVTGLSMKDKKKDLKQFFHPLKLKSVRLPRLIKGIAFIGFKTEKEMKQALTKNRSFLGGKRVQVLVYTKKEKDDNTKTDNKLPKWHVQEELLKNEETVAESGRIFVRNLSYATTEADLESLFQPYGETTEVNMPIDRRTRTPKGFAHVSFMFPEHAMKAFIELDGTVFNGRMLHLIPAKAKVSIEAQLEKDGLSFTDKKQLKLKVQAGSSHNWNSLFLGQNAVADVVAATYDTTKENLLDSRGNESVAVRLALGETQIVNQTRDFLLQKGVRLDAFKQAPAQRSKTIFLVKNLPALTTEKEIVDLFQPHGELNQVILPPSGITAIVEFQEPSEARTAFTRMAYTKFKNLPLYLEWAPFDTFSPTLPEENSSSVAAKSEINKATKSVEGKDAGQVEHVSKSQTNDNDDEPPEAEALLYVKNINFRTNEKDLKEHFSQCGEVHSVTIATKKDVKDPSQLLSMGYGFVQFKKKAGAEAALKTMHQVVFQEHALDLKRSHRTVATEVVSTRKKTVIGAQTGSKILVRNIPFQANRKEIETFFKTFGVVKSVRMPRKALESEGHRGFGFIEYETKSDAKRAFESVCQSSHLYGRRLVLEWAAKEESVEELRKRTADHFFSGSSSSSKNLRKSTFDLEEGSEEENDETEEH